MTSAESTIYKVTTSTLWARAEAEGILPPSPVDEKDGFMHFSTAGQLRETLRLHFAGEGNLVLCAVPVAPIAEKLKWEPSRGGALFPHLYAALSVSAVAAHYPISVAKDGTCLLPEGFN
jgi:uncharacterized protein (DUF952 family)